MSIKNFTLFIAMIISAGAAAEDAAGPAWKYFYEKGRLQYSASMYDYAQFSMRRALEENPGLYQAANILGEIFIHGNKRLDALDQYNASLAIKEDQSEIHYRAGELCEFFIDHDKAFAHFRRAVEIDPGHIKANMALVRYYIVRKDPAAAEIHFTASKSAAEKKSAGTMAEAAAAARDGKIKKAMRLYDKVLADYPSVIEAYLRLYETARETKNYVRAVEAMEKLKFMKPDYRRAYVNLGHIYFDERLPGKRKLNIDKAVRNFTKALEMDPTDTETAMNLSRIFRYTGRVDEAARYEAMAGIR
jgi:tetratricopeptide (TPR) repeat protein